MGKRIKLKMEAKEIFLEQRTVFPTGEIYPNIDNKYKLSIKERLEGRWTIEVREHIGTTKTKKLSQLLIDVILLI